MIRVRAGVLLLVVLGFAGPAAAQRTTGEIIGRVTDESGAVLPGVTVTLSGAGVAGTPTVVTPETGTYRFPLLPPGTYDLEYTLGGFNTLKRTRDSGRGRLDRRTGDQAHGRRADRSAHRQRRSAGRQRLVRGSEHVLQPRMGAERAGAAVLVLRSDQLGAGVSATSNVGQSTAAQSLGSSTNENSYQIDGTDISSTPWPNTDAVEEVEVLQLGASAEYGNVQGAVFNIVTRQGSNVFHGDANVYFQSDALTGRNTTDAADRGFPYHRETWRDATVQASGPFMRDKFWFFGSLQYQRDYDSQPGVDPQFPAKNDARRVFWKFNYNLNQNHRLMHGYHDDYYWIPGTPTAFTAPSTIGLSHGDNPTPNLVYTGVLSDTTFLEVRYSGFWLQSSTDPNEDGQPRVATRFVDDDTGLITGGIANWSENRSWRYGLSGEAVAVQGERCWAAATT